MRFIGAQHYTIAHRAAIDWPTSLVMRMKDAPELLEILDGVVQVVCYGHTGSGAERAYQRKANSTAWINETLHLDANASVPTQTYFEITFDGTKAPTLRTLEV